MQKRVYSHVQAILPEIKLMLSEGKSHKEIEEFFNLTGDRPLHNLLKRERRKERKILSGEELRPQGAKPKGINNPTKEKDYEIKRLKMENELLRDFLHLSGRM